MGFSDKSKPGDRKSPRWINYSKSAGIKLYICGSRSGFFWRQDSFRWDRWRTWPAHWHECHFQGGLWIGRLWMRCPVYTTHHCFESYRRQRRRSKSNLFSPERAEIWRTRGCWNKFGLNGRWTAQESRKLFIQWWIISRTIGKITTKATSSCTSSTTAASTITRCTSPTSTWSSVISSTRAGVPDLRGESPSSYEAGAVWGWAYNVWLLLWTGGDSLKFLFDHHCIGGIWFQVTRGSDGEAKCPTCRQPITGRPCQLETLLGLT